MSFAQVTGREPAPAWPVAAFALLLERCRFSCGRSQTPGLGARGSPAEAGQCRGQSLVFRYGEQRKPEGRRRGRDTLRQRPGRTQRPSFLRYKVLEIKRGSQTNELKMKGTYEVRHLYICDFHKNFIQSVRNKRKRKTSDDGGDSPEHETDVPEVDLFQLQVNTLRRYKRHYKLQTRPGLNKAQLAETVSRHFRNIPVNEKETLAYFIYMVKNNKSRLDQKSESSKQLE
ncbi:PREDICTED: histone deacetylase complex subunit SAP30L [Charadrius vociferus]|nr:PREDICTED: histone deacetylase complex subunit SAP30L [Charadrius vociferus]